jgi:hypothetical protein
MPSPHDSAGPFAGLREIGREVDRLFDELFPAVQGGTDAAIDGMGCRTLPVPTEVKGAAAKTAYHDGVPEGRRPKSERGKAIAAKVKVES